jgi:hypothetical protein
MISSYAPPGPYKIKKPLPALTEVLTDKILTGLCDGSGDFGRYGTLQYDIGKALHTQLLQTPLSKAIGGRLELKNRFPVFGKDGHSFTKKPVGYNDPRKRVTIPCFDIVACPAVPVDVFKEHRIDEIRGIFQESITAIGLAELGYFHQLLNAVAANGLVYPQISAKGHINEDVILDACAIMEHKEYKPTAIFVGNGCCCLRRVMYHTEGTLGGIPITTFDCPESNAYVFGQPKNPKLTNALLVDNDVKFRIKITEYGGLYDWKTPVELRLSEGVGFLCGAACALKITCGREDSIAEPTKKARIRAYVIGETGDSVVSVL